MMIKFYDRNHIEIYAIKEKLDDEDTFWNMFYDTMYVDIQSGFDDFVSFLDYYNYITDDITENGMYKFDEDNSTWKRIENFVEYRPMVHAYWDFRTSYSFKCSNCGEISYSISHRFCPNCGALMVGYKPEL